MQSDDVSCSTSYKQFYMNFFFLFARRCHFIHPEKIYSIYSDINSFLFSVRTFNRRSFFIAFAQLIGMFISRWFPLQMILRSRVYTVNWCRARAEHHQTPATTTRISQIKLMGNLVGSNLIAVYAIEKGAIFFLIVLKN